MLVYTIFISPLILLMKTYLTFFYKLTDSHGFSIILLSILVNTLLLPLYKLAEAWQNQNRLAQDKMQPRLQAIRKSYTGEARHALISTLYKQEHYHPFYILKASFGLLLQIPFFMAAYQYLSHLSVLDGESFLFLSNLAQADGLLWGVNLMPLVMTAVNVFASSLYASSFRKKEWRQLLILAGVFLVLLYNSPSGLLLYWTFNNIYALGKNVVLHRKKAQKQGIKDQNNASDAIDLSRMVQGYGFFAIGLSIVKTIFTAFKNNNWFTELPNTYFYIIAILGIIPFLVRYWPLYKRWLLWLCLVLLYGYFKATDLVHFQKSGQENAADLLFFLFLLHLVLLPKLISWLTFVQVRAKRLFFYSGVSYILLLFSLALFLISSSPSDFPQDISYYFNKLLPMALLMCILLGIFLLVVGPNLLNQVSLISLFILFSALLNSFVFVVDYGEISSFLFMHAERMGNDLLEASLSLMSIILASGILLFFFLKKRLDWLETLLKITCLTLLVSVFIPFFSRHNPENTLANKTSVNFDEDFVLSRNHNNVIVLFLDRFSAGFVGHALEEHPIWYSELDGFTFFTNAMSYGRNTFPGSLSMMGGYDYVPQALDVSDKENEENVIEAFSLLPQLMAENGFDSFVKGIPLLAGFNTAKYQEVATDFQFSMLRGKYSQKWLSDPQNASFSSQKSVSLNSFFLAFSLFRSSYAILRQPIYNDGAWLGKRIGDISKAIGNYSMLDYLPETSVTKYTKKPQFYWVSNDLTHETNTIDSNGMPTRSGVQMSSEDMALFDSENTASSYYANEVSLKLILDWIHWMKEEGVYDNTRIIVTADHGINEKIQYDYYWKNGSFSEELGRIAMNVHPAFFFKDFNSKGNLEENAKFTTVAETLHLAIKDEIVEAKNVYSGDILQRNDLTQEQLIYILESARWQHQKKYGLNVRDIYGVSNNLLDNNNWKKYGGSLAPSP